MRMGIAGGVLCAFLLSVGGGAWAQGTPASAPGAPPFVVQVYVSDVMVK